MNGTAVMTGLACPWQRADYLARMATRLTAFNVLASDGNAHHFDETLFAAAAPGPGPHRRAPAQRPAAASVRHAMNSACRTAIRRCAPHVIGVLEDSLPFLRQLIETELNSANDNPLIDADGERILHGGHFRRRPGDDTLKNTVANALTCRPAAGAGGGSLQPWPAGQPVGGHRPARAAINHGLKALQISVSAGPQKH